MNQRIEDDYTDVLSKAIRGQALSLEDLSKRSGVDLFELKPLLAGEFNASNLTSIAPCVGLSTNALIQMASESWLPSVVLPEGVLAYETPYPLPGYADMRVNSFLLFDAKSRKAIAVDTGATAKAMLSDVSERDLIMEKLLLTHTHRDHVAAMDAVRAELVGMNVFSPALEPWPESGNLEEGLRITVGTLEVEVLLTNGHSPGGLSFVVHGLSSPLAFVGDAIFCMSIGKAPNASAYAQALTMIEEKLLTLAPETILCPGHGPMTTVGDELKRNPFFAC